MPISTVTSKGQITLPKEVRELLHLAEGDRVEFLIERDGRVRLSPVSGSVRSLLGLVRRADRNTAPTLEEMDEALTESLVADDERIRRGES